MRPLSAGLLLLLTVATVITAQYHSGQGDSPFDYCKNLSPQNSLDLSQLMGMWYGVEIVYHRDDRRHGGLAVVEACPVLHLSLSQHSDTELRLLWDEDAGVVEYVFHITSHESLGFWLSSGPQTGTMLKQPYKQFAGTAQVMKAVASHVVLTFCSPNTELYTIVMSRQKHLDRSELEGVHKLLERRGLVQYGIREACKSSAVRLASGLLLVLALFRPL